MSSAEACCTLEVQHHEQRHPADAEHHRQSHPHDGAERRRTEEPHVEHRVRAAELDPDERDQGDKEDRKGEQDARIAVADVPALDDGVRQSQQRHGGEDQAGDVHAPTPAAAVVHDERRDEEDDQRQRDVDQEDAVPGEVVEHDTGHQGTTGQADARAARPDADRLHALAGIMEALGDDGQAVGQDHGAADAHQRLGGDERPAVVHAERDEAAGPQDGDAQEEDGAPPGGGGRVVDDADRA